MKKMWVAMFFLITIISCDNTSLIHFAKEVIRHPETINDLRKFYPKFYDDNLISQAWLKDDYKQIIEAINYYKGFPGSKTVKMRKAEPINIEWYFRAKSKDYKLSDIYVLSFWNGPYGVIFILIKKHEKYFIYSISSGYILDYFKNDCLPGISP